MGRWLITLVLALACATAGHAQMVRQFPANSKLGNLVGQQEFPLVLIENKPMRLAPGALIYDQNNRTILHNLLPERAYVVFVQEATGDVTRIYLLRPEELEMLKRTRER